jgi:hypothetical protein
MVQQPQQQMYHEKQDAKNAKHGQPIAANKQYVPQEGVPVQMVPFQPTGQYIVPGQQQLYDVGQYEGDINAQGQREGNGKVAWLDGSEYVGEFKNGMRHGKGRYTRKDGYTYDGEWKDDTMHG